MDFSENIVLQNDTVLLRPLMEGDYEDLKDIAFNPDIWKYNVTSSVNEQELKKWMDDSIEARKNQLRYPFTIESKMTNKVVGSTSIGNVSLTDKRAEIGWTWLGRDYQETGINKQCKFLLLQHLFDVLNFERVEFKTDLLNIKSRRALKNIGATEEGILRSHTLMHDGRRRDTIYFSIFISEWLTIKKKIFGK